MSRLKSLFGCCIGKIQNPPGSISREDMREMLAMAKRRNVELKKLIHHLEEDIDAEKKPMAMIRHTPRYYGNSQKFTGWVQFMKTDESRYWRKSWAILENGRLTFYREEDPRSVKLVDMDLSSCRWNLEFRRGPFPTDQGDVPEHDLPNLIVLNFTDNTSADGFSRLYINTGSEESKNEWMRALELAICGELS